MEVANAYRESLTSPIRKVIYRLLAQDPNKDAVEHKDDICSLTVRVDMCNIKKKRPEGARERQSVGFWADPEIMRGEPCIKGTRIPVYALAAIAEAKGPEAALRTYPQCSLHHVEAARRYALAYPPRGRPKSNAPKVKDQQDTRKVVGKKVKSLAAVTGAATPRFGLLIDENLSPELADEAKARGFDALHVTWIGSSQGSLTDLSQGMQSENERTLVTNDAVDFRHIYEKKELHPGIVFLTFSDWRLMDLDGQVASGKRWMRIERDFPVNELIEVELSYDEDNLTLTLSRSPLPDWPGW